MKKILLPLIAVLLLASNAFAADGNVVIIANKSVPVSSITSATLKLIYLGKKNTWSDGSVIVPVTLQSGGTHEAFLSQFIEKSSSQYSSFWKQAIFTGEGTPPRSFATMSELVSYVANTPGAIGYVTAGASMEEVKVLKVE
jgi:ABC-type phosphate transport system substrate-binding protein